MRNIVCTLFLCMAVSFAADAQSVTNKDFSTLQAIVGTWKTEGKVTNTIYEQWYLQDDHTLSGKSFMLKTTDTVTLETVKLHIDGDKIYYIPTVSKQNNGQAIPFTLISSQGKRFVFENKEHDFPQRVIYHLADNNTLHARIEGTKNGQTRGSDFNYVRVQ